MTEEWIPNGLNNDNESLSWKEMPNPSQTVSSVSVDYPQGMILREDRKRFLLGASDFSIRGTSDDGFWAGSAVFATAPFSVSLAGVCSITTLTVGTLTVNTGIIPDANDGAYLGTGALGFSDLFLASGGVINWANGNSTITHSTGVLTIAGAITLNNLMTANIGIVPDANDGAYLGTGALGFSDLFLASGGVINWANGNVAITHSTGALSITGAITLTNLAGSGSRMVVTDANGLLSPVAIPSSPLMAAGATSQQITNSGQSACQVITHNLGVVPKLIKVYASATGSNRLVDSHGVSVNGGLGECVYNYYSVTTPLSLYTVSGRIVMLDDSGTLTEARMDASDTTTFTLRWYSYNNVWDTDANMVWECYA